MSLSQIARVQRMEVHIDKTKVYTSGEWIHGTVKLFAHNSTVKDISVKLQGILSCQARINKFAVTKSKCVYTVTGEIDTQSVGAHSFKGYQFLKFSVRFPGHEHDKFKKIPASIACRDIIPECEFHHMVTVSVKWKGHSTKLQQSVELEFMPSANISLLLEPNVVYNKTTSQVHIYKVVFSVPRFLSQGKSTNTIVVQYPRGFKDIKIEVCLGISGSIRGVNYIKRYDPLVRESVSGYSMRYILRDNFNYSPGFALSHAVLRYTLRIFVVLRDEYNHDWEFLLEKPVEVLPTLLFMSHRADFASPNDICFFQNQRLVSLG